MRNISLAVTAAMAAVLVTAVGATATTAIEPPRKVEVGEASARVDLLVSCLSPDHLGYLYASVSQERRGIETAVDGQQAVVCDGAVRSVTVTLSGAVDQLHQGHGSMFLQVFPNCLFAGPDCTGYESSSEKVVLTRR